MEVVKTLRKGMVPRAGVEPARPFGQRILSPQRLPFRHPGTRSEHTMRIQSGQNHLSWLPRHSRKCNVRKHQRSTLTVVTQAQ